MNCKKLTAYWPGPIVIFDTSANRTWANQIKIGHAHVCTRTSLTICHSTLTTKRVFVVLSGSAVASIARKFSWTIAWIKRVCARESQSCTALITRRIAYGRVLSLNHLNRAFRIGSYIRNIILLIAYRIQMSNCASNIHSDIF